MRTSKLPAPVLDVALAVALGLVVQAQVWWGVNLGGHTGIAGPKLLIAGLFLLIGFPLVFRRDAPLAVAVAMFVAVVAQAVISQSAAEGVGLALTLLVTMYSLGAYATRRAGVVGLALMAVTLTVSIILDPLVRTPAERWSAAFFTLFPLLAWAIGVGVRGWRHGRQLERDAARIAETQAEALADERSRIARELHDVIAHHLSVVVLQSVAAQGVLADDPERARTPLAEIERNGRASLTEMRRMLEVIRADDAAPVEPQPAATDVAALAEGARHAGLPVTLQVEGDPPTDSPSLSLTVYRIVQEALTNALKHSGGAATRVNVVYASDRAEIEVVDDGHTHPVGSVGGHGLLGMAERVAIFNGRIETGRGPTGGFRVFAVLPYPESG